MCSTLPSPGSLTMIFFRIRTPPISAPDKKALLEAEIRVNAGKMRKQAISVFDWSWFGSEMVPNPEAR